MLVASQFLVLYLEDNVNFAYCDWRAHNLRIYIFAPEKELTGGVMTYLNFVGWPNRRRSARARYIPCYVLEQVGTIKSWEDNN